MSEIVHKKKARVPKPERSKEEDDFLRWMEEDALDEEAFPRAERTEALKSDPDSSQTSSESHE